MKVLLGIFGVLCTFFGWIASVTSTFIWVAHGVYELVKTDLPFWDILLGNGGLWLLQIVLGLLLLALGYVITKIAAQ